MGTDRGFEGVTMVTMVKRECVEGGVGQRSHSARGSVLFLTKVDHELLKPGRMDDQSRFMSESSERGSKGGPGGSVPDCHTYCLRSLARVVGSPLGDVS